jgi:hypothetical protein
MARRILGILVVLYIVGLFVLAVWPVPLEPDAASWIADSTGLAGVVPIAAIDAVLHGLLYLPLGILIAAAFRPGARWLAFAVCLAVAAATEFLQVMLLGNGSDFGFSLVGAAVGAAIGVLIVAIISAIRAPRAKPATA